MKMVECRGSHRDMGRAMGEGLRSEIREHIAGFVRHRADEVGRELRAFEETLARHVPCVLEQLKGIAAGADVPETDVLMLNLPVGAVGQTISVDGCTNVAFGHGPDGPLWGKNNDGNHPPNRGPVTDACGRRPVAALKLYPDDGIPAICVVFCGWLSGGDMMNAEGVAVGHSSVGSRFLQSSQHVPVLQWMYWIMLQARTAADYAQRLASLPTLGKGFSQLVADANGTMFSAEIPCPLAQFRLPESGAVGMNCVNCYQLPFLQGMDRRSPESLANAQARIGLLEQAVDDGDRGIEHMQRLLRHHGEPAICRHGGADGGYTEYSMIGVTRERRMLIADGNPCEVSYVSVGI